MKFLFFSRFYRGFQHIFYYLCNQMEVFYKPKEISRNHIQARTKGDAKGRFAPSPSGRMHLGNVYAALLSWLSAKKKGGSWVLRIEDLDPQRCKLEYALQLEDDLRWLGLDWDEGGTENRGCCGPYLQSLRSEIYEEYLDRLNKTGLTYPCTCTRADIMATQAPHESDGRIVYKGTCRPANIPSKEAERITSSTPAAIRLYVPDMQIDFIDSHYGVQSINLATHCGDFVLRRKDGAWAYQLAVVVDDALMGITEVVRGRDLLLSASQQLYLYNILSLQAPEFIHFPLLCNNAGQRLSKRDKSLDMGVLRSQYTPEQIIGEIAYYAGQTDCPEPMNTEELLKIFTWKKVPTNDITIN